MYLDQSLIERQANCRIWVHLLLWWLVPFGWVLSVYKMRYASPFYIMLAAICISGITLPSPSGNSSQEVIQRSYEHGQKYGFVAGIAGSVLTVREIVKSRRKAKATKEL